MAWTIAKLTTLHRTIRPELLEMPNVLVTAEAAQLGAADTTPDNLYMLGTFRLAPDEALVIEIEPPATRYWSVTLENIWHECIDPRRRRSSITNAAVVPDGDGRVRIVAAATDPGVDNWIDTGGRHRGFVTVRWLDNPDPPMVKTSVMAVSDVTSRRNRSALVSRAPIGTLLPFAAGWSSLVARRAHNPKVGGSNPPPATI